MRTAEQMIAYALEIDPQLLPFVPALLADLEELGGDADLIVEEVAALGLPPGARVLDLGCGKGAAAVAIAAQLGLTVCGVDLYAPFIPLCQAAAAAAGVAEHCSFRHGDILTLAEQHPDLLPADLVVFAALGDVLGPLETTVGILRRYVRPGGFLIICDDYLRAGGSTDFAGFAGYRPREETGRALEAHGDRLLRVVEEPDDQIAADHSVENAAIRRRALDLAERHPALRAAFLAFADDQQAETDFIEQNMVAALWVLQRSPA